MTFIYVYNLKKNLGVFLEDDYNINLNINIIYAEDIFYLYYIEKKIGLESFFYDKKCKLVLK